MTKKSIALSELADKGSDIDMLREMLSFVSHRLMELDIEEDVAKLREFALQHSLAKKLKHRARSTPAWMVPYIDAILAKV